MGIIRRHYLIIIMIAVLILLPIILSILATKYEACKFIKKGCFLMIVPPHSVKPGDIHNQSLDEVVCWDSKPEATKPVYKDLNTGKCYGFVEGQTGLGSSPPPSNANLVRIGDTEK